MLLLGGGELQIWSPALMGAKRRVLMDTLLLTMSQKTNLSYRPLLLIWERGS
jgi:hypothetical protein